MEATANAEPVELPPKSDAATNLALVLPVFVAYHLGVVTLPLRNAADPVTTELRALAEGNLFAYALLTLALGSAVAAALWVVGERRAFEGRRFVLVGLEGVLYAIIMKTIGSYVVGSLSLGLGAPVDPFTGVVLSLGAGLYEEIAFRTLLFGGGAWLVRLWMGDGARGTLATLAWGLAASAIFSGWHYVGPLADPFDATSFTFRFACGAVLTAIYALRGFAPAVWTHAIYDVWAFLGR